MLEILTAAETTALVELATVKAHLRPAPVGTTEDQTLADLIRWASAAVNRFCRRTFARQEYRETLPGTGSQILTLSRGPVEADADRLVTLVELNGSAITDYRVEDGVAGVLWRKIGWPARVGARGLYGQRADPSVQDREAIVVEYWAGYLLPGDDPVAGAAALPADVEMAALETVRAWRAAAGRDPGIASTSSTESEGDRSRTVAVGYAAGSSAAPIGSLPARAQELLRAYRR